MGEVNRKGGRKRRPPSADILKPLPKNKNLPNIIDPPEGDNTKFTNFAVALMRLPKIDIEDAGQLQERIIDYFSLCAEHDIKPGVAGVSVAIGIDRRRMWEIKTGQAKQLCIPPECKKCIIDLYDSLENLWEMYTQHGKINPVSSIFLAKNNFGYVDKQEHVLTPNQMGNNVDPATISAKYEELPE